MQILMYHIDAFADRPFAGNAAAVCPLPHWLPDETLQAVAEENRLSETAFLVGADCRYDLRWFTPETEVDLCGHATLAAAFVVFHYLEPGCREVVFSTASGPLTVTSADGYLIMDFPARTPVPCDIPPGLVEGLGVLPLACLRSRDYMALLPDEDAVRALRPQMSLLAALDSLGVIVTAPGRDVDFVSRFFAPRVGVPEDPVTGSAHSTLIPYWSEQLGKKRLRARQVSKRGGELLCEAMGDRVRIAGKAVLYLEGTLLIPGEGQS